MVADKLVVDRSVHVYRIRLDVLAMKGNLRLASGKRIMFVVCIRAEKLAENAKPNLAHFKAHSSNFQGSVMTRSNSF